MREPYGPDDTRADERALGWLDVPALAVQCVLGAGIVALFVTVVFVSFESGKRQAALGELAAKGIPTSHEAPVDVRHRRDVDMVEFRIDDGHMRRGDPPVTVLTGPPGSAIVVRDVPAGGIPWVEATDVANGRPVRAGDTGSGGRHPVADMTIHVASVGDYVESTD